MMTEITVTTDRSCARDTMLLPSRPPKITTRFYFDTKGLEEEKRNLLYS